MTTEKIKVIDSIYRELCKWEVRTACNDNPIAALIFLIFLKFTSDNSAHLELDLKEIDYNDIVADYQEKIKSDIIDEYVKNIETQLGTTNGVLYNYTNRLP